VTVNIANGVWSSAWQVNTFTADIQDQPTGTALDDTTVVIAWISRNQAYYGGAWNTAAVGQIVSSTGANEGTEFFLSPNLQDPAKFGWSGQSAPVLTTVDIGRFVSAFTNTNSVFGNDLIGSSWQRKASSVYFTATVPWYANEDGQTIAEPTKSPQIWGAPYSLWRQPGYYTSSLSFSIDSNAGSLSNDHQDPLYSPVAAPDLYTSTVSLETINDWLTTLKFTPNRYYVTDFNVTWTYTDGVVTLPWVQPFANQDTAPTLRTTAITLNYYDRRAAQMMSTANFDCDDARFSDDALWYNFTNVKGGSFSWADNKNVIVQSFSAKQVKDSVVVFLDRGNNDASTRKSAVVTGMTVVCSNPLKSSAPVDLTVTISGGTFLQPALLGFFFLVLGLWA